MHESKRKRVALKRDRGSDAWVRARGGGDAVARRLNQPSIYTEALARRGIVLPSRLEEIVLETIRVKDADEAVRLANATEFGLGAALWTTDLERARVLVRRIEAGAVFVNGMVASDPRLPFGGIKQSGYGRELGAFGAREFTNVKTVWIGPAV